MEKITLRLKEGQYQVLSELRDALGCNIAVIVRAIIGDFLQKNEDTLERIITEYNESGVPLNKMLDIDDD
jgi:hypothetical protein